MDAMDSQILERMREPCFRITSYRAIAEQVAREFKITWEYVYWLPVDHITGEREDWKFEFYPTGWTEPNNRRREAIEVTKSKA